MLTMSHTYMAKNTLKFLEMQGFDVLDRKSFVYGNIKPDTLFQKTPKIHLEKESLPFILNQIEILSSCDKDNKMMSLELGIVCHYLCDYFCLPHFERWSKCPLYKKIVQTPKHLNYERMLCSYVYNATMDFKDIHNVEEFLSECKEEYIKNKSFENDIIFASLVCNSVVLYILKNNKKYKIDK